MKPGYKSSELYLTIATALGIMATAVDAVEKSQMLQHNPIAVAILASVVTIAVAAQSIAYTLGRSTVKAADLSTPAVETTQAVG